MIDNDDEEPWFEWDEEKAADNLRKHRIGFPLAVRIFEDASRLEIEDRGAYGEQRYIAFGVVDGRRLVVVYTYRGEGVRLISARMALGTEWPL